MGFGVEGLGFRALTYGSQSCEQALGVRFLHYSFIRTIRKGFGRNLRVDKNFQLIGEYCILDMQTFMLGFMALAARVRL